MVCVLVKVSSKPGLAYSGFLQANSIGFAVMEEIKVFLKSLLQK